MIIKDIKFFLIFFLAVKREYGKKNNNSKVRLIKILKKSYIHLSISTDGNV